MWNLPPPPGFQGLREDLPLRIYFRHLPHWRQEGATYFVTFRLIDALPKNKLLELDQLRAVLELNDNIPNSFRDAVEHSTLRFKGTKSLDDLYNETMKRIERLLDRGAGSCVLNHTEVAAKLVESLHFFDGQRYELGCYVVMPNHCHAVLRPLRCETSVSTHSVNEGSSGAYFPLERILQSWKRRSAFEINRLLERPGSLWQDESYDRIIRDEEHLFRTIQYVGNNPDFAGLPRSDCPMWIRPSWAEIGWMFEWML